MQPKKFVCNTLEELDRQAGDIHDLIKEEKFVLFEGEMGAGKTTLIKALCKKAGVLDAVGSPTFSIVNEYKTLAGQTIYHFDFYRIKNLQEAFDIGYEEYFFSGHQCFIEWPEKIQSLLNFKTALVQVLAKDEIRSIIITL
jgi:tRNA threonylcarbamoyladenosine biosynthesis protein TsaE